MVEPAELSWLRLEEADELEERALDTSGNSTELISPKNTLLLTAYLTRIRAHVSVVAKERVHSSEAPFSTSGAAKIASDDKIIVLQCYTSTWKSTELPIAYKAS